MLPHSDPFKYLADKCLEHNTAFLCKKPAFLQLSNCKKAAFLHKKAVFLQIYIFVKKQLFYNYIIVKKLLFYIKKQLFYTDRFFT